MGLTEGTNFTGLAEGSTYGITSSGASYGTTVGTSVGTSGQGNLDNGYSIGFTTDSSKSGLEVETNSNINYIVKF